MATVEATTQKVQRILADAYNDVRLRKNGGFLVPGGSTAAFVEIQEWTPDKDGNPRTLVYIWAPLGREVKPTEDLYHWAAVDGQQFRLGTVTVLDEKDAGLRCCGQGILNFISHCVPVVLGFGRRCATQMGS